MANRYREKPVEEAPRRRQTPIPETPKETDDSVNSEETRESESTGTSENTGKDQVKLGKAERRLAHLLGGDALGDKFVIRQIPLVLLCLGCFLYVVHNRYNVEKIIKDKNETTEQISRLRERRIEMQKQYQQGVKISRIAEVLQESGVGITAGPPYVIEK